MKVITIIFFLAIIAIGSSAVYYYIQINRYAYQANQLIRVDKITNIVETFNATESKWEPVKPD